MKRIRYILLLAALFSVWPGVRAGNSGSGKAQGLYVTFETSQKSALVENEAFLNRIPVSALPLSLGSEKSLWLEAYASPLALSASRTMDGVYIVYVKDGVDADEAMAVLQREKNVKYVEKVPEYHLCAVPNDTYYGMQAGLNLKWHLDLIRAEEAWALQSASAEITVAVVDNAVWGEHEDLNIPKENQYSTRTGDSTSSPLDLGLGLDQDEICEQEDLEYSTCESYNWSHGTHVAGLLAAISNNGKGVASLGSGVKLLAVSAPSLGAAMAGNPYEGIRWAVNHGAKVINCSWASYSSTQTERNMIAGLIEQGIFIVAGAGNGSRYDELNYPAAYPGVISVGACNADKTRAKRGAFGSNYGGWVDVMAPGGQGPTENEKMFSTTFSSAQVLPNSGYLNFEGVYYDYMEGSSMATPLVSALCALILSRDSTVTIDEMVEILTSTAQKGTDLGISEASGIIDAAAALQAVDSRVHRVKPSYISSFSGVCESGIAKVYWRVDTESGEDPDFLRLYRNGVLVEDNLPFATGNHIDTIAAIQTNHKYELCGVRDGVESYRKEAFVTIGTYYEIRVSAQPAGAGKIYGAGRYLPSSYCRLTAEPNPGYRFVKWSYFDQWTGEEYENPTLDLKVDREYLGIAAHFESGVATEQKTEASWKMHVYPNPVLCLLHIDIPSSFRAERITVYHASGIQAGTYPYVSSIDVSDLVSGLYFIRIEDAAGHFAVTKFVKK